MLIERAEQANFHLIGPNCMGIFNPMVGIRQMDRQYTGFAGPVGFIAQSGGLAINFSLEAHLQGMDINKSVSFGNGVVLDSTDFLSYFAGDPEIKIIGMYLEGVKDGRRFVRVLREVAAQKPVVIWKGGRTEEGGRAIASHTGSLAVPQMIWEAAVRQCGAIQVGTMEELIDTLKALMYLPPVHGDGVAMVGMGGGQSVSSTDECVEAGLRLPPLTQESYDELDTFFSLVGGYYNNPIDIGNPNREQIKRITGILERDDNTDNLVLLLSIAFSNTKQVRSHIDLMTDIRKRTPKPVMAIVPFSNPKEMRRASEVTQKLQDGGVPAFPSIKRGATALKNALDYYSFKSSIDT
ncbi:Peptidyl-lysine N-acetyltransferase Pat [subsurface metagenome]